MKNKTIAYGAAGVVTYLTVDYLYTQISNSIKESFNRKLRHARNVGWSNGFDDGYHQGRLSAAMFIDNDAYRRIYGHDFSEEFQKKA